jgi:hypothetical protein
MQIEPMPTMPGTTKGNFRSFVNDIDKDFPTVDEFYNAKKDKQQKQISIGRGNSRSPRKAKLQGANRSQNRNYSIENPRVDLDLKKAKEQLAEEQDM